MVLLMANLDYLLDGIITGITVETLLWVCLSSSHSGLTEAGRPALTVDGTVSGAGVQSLTKRRKRAEHGLLSVAAVGFNPCHLPSLPGRRYPQTAGQHNPLLPEVGFVTAVRKVPAIVLLWKTEIATVSASLGCDTRQCRLLLRTRHRPSGPGLHLPHTPLPE